MVRKKGQPLAGDVSPQAIIWRHIKYFSDNVITDEDGLDSFQCAAFVIGNKVFDLRNYRGHPTYTVTLYLPFEVEETEEIFDTIGAVISQLAVPQSALAWKRGDAMGIGTLERPRNDRLREPEARNLALKIASQCDDHTASTEFIKKSFPDYTELSVADLRPSRVRHGEALWQQIVGNVISHKETGTSLFSRGLATRTSDGLRVTAVGLRHLKNIGFI